MIRALVLLWLVAPGAAADSPHDRPDACLVCHVAGKKGAVGAPKPATAVCSGCHAEDARDMHAVGVVAPSYVTVPASWPLEDGRVSCATCHAEPACDPARAKAPPFHRGAPYADPQGFCFQCHQRDEFGRTDPHHAGVGDTGTCTACHVSLPEAGAAPEDAALRVAPGEVCAFCHGAAGHLGTATHLGRSASTALPLHDGAIACWTCHDVHDAPAPGAAKARPGGDAVRSLAETHWDGLERLASQPGHPPLLALPLDDGALCRACHGEGP